MRNAALPTRTAEGQRSDDVSTDDCKVMQYERQQNSMQSSLAAYKQLISSQGQQRRFSTTIMSLISCSEKLDFSLRGALGLALRMKGTV